MENLDLSRLKLSSFCITSHIQNVNSDTSKQISISNPKQKINKIKIIPYNKNYKNDPETKFSTLFIKLDGKTFFQNDANMIIEILQSCILYIENLNLYKIFISSEDEETICRNYFKSLVFYIDYGKNIIKKFKLSGYLNEKYNGRRVKYYLSESEDANEYEGFYPNSDDEDGILYNGIPEETVDEKFLEKSSTFNNLMEKYRNTCSEPNNKGCININKLINIIENSDKIILEKIIGSFDKQNKLTRNISSFISNRHYSKYVDYEIIRLDNGRIMGNRNNKSMIFKKESKFS